MAEGISPIARSTPKWSTSQFEGDILGPLGITDLLKNTGSLLETVINISTVLQTALQWVSSFIVDLTNPIRPLLQGLIAYITALISDLRKMGLYITFSDGLFRAIKSKRALNLEELYTLSNGGYPTALTELTRKYLDTNDPTRPNFTAASSSYTMVFFAGGGVAGLKTLLSLVSQIGGLFGKANFASLANPPTITSVTANSKTEPTEASIEYQLEAKNTAFNLPPPAFYLVISTRNKPYSLFFKDEFGRVTPLITKEGLPLDTRYVPFFDDSENIFAITEDGEEIPLENFKPETKALLIEKSALNRIFGTLNFDDDIKYSEFPSQKYDTKTKTLVPETSNFYLSMMSLPVSSDLTPKSTPAPKEKADFRLENKSDSAIPALGAIFPHTKYGEVQNRYLLALKESIYRYLLAVLSEEFSVQLEKIENNTTFASIEAEQDVRSISAEKDLFEFRGKIKSEANRLLNKFSRRGILTKEYISENLTQDIDRVLNAEVSFTSLFETDLRKKTKVGVYPIGGGGEELVQSPFPIPSSIEEVFFINPKGRNGVGLKTFLGGEKERLVQASAYRLVGTLPKRATSVGVGGNWLFAKLLSDGVPGLEPLLELIREFLQLTEEGMQGVLDALLSFIAVLEERIAKLQAILRLIQEVLASLTKFKIPAGVAVLGFEANGVSDIVSKLQRAENSPKVSGGGVLGFYMAMTIGGVPAIFAEILRAFIGEEGGE